MSEKTVTLSIDVSRSNYKPVRVSVKEALNEQLEAEAEMLMHVECYEHNEARQGYRRDQCDRSLTTTSGYITLHVLQLKSVPFETVIIEQYCFHILKAVHAKERKKIAIKTHGHIGFSRIDLRRSGN